MVDCHTCSYRLTAHKVNYGELTSLGREIEVNDCWGEFYDEELEDCVCTNYKKDELCIVEKRI